MKLDDLFETKAEWRTVKDFPNYEVSSTGQVRVKKTKRILSQQQHFGNDKKHPYMRVVLTNGDVRKNMRVHRLVAFAFHGEPPLPNMEVDHKDAVTKHNKPENLEWVTPEENIKRKQGKRTPPPRRSIQDVKRQETSPN